jgi:hypothetical protein
MTTKTKTRDDARRRSLAVVMNVRPSRKETTPPPSFFSRRVASRRVASRRVACRRSLASEAKQRRLARLRHAVRNRAGTPRKEKTKNLKNKSFARPTHIHWANSHEGCVRDYMHIRSHFRLEMKKK